MKGRATLLAVSVAFALAACSSEADPQSGEMDSEPADASTSVTQEIVAAAGGSLALTTAAGWAATVDIPAGALSSDAELTVRELDSQDFPAGLADGVSAAAFQVVGADGPLEKPATITIRTQPSAALVAEASLLATVDEDGRIEVLQGVVTTISPDGGVEVTGSTTHFSPFLKLSGTGAFRVGWASPLPEEILVGESATASMVAFQGGFLPAAPRYLRSDTPCTEGTLRCDSAGDEIPFTQRSGGPPPGMEMFAAGSRTWELDVAWSCSESGDDEYVARVANRLPSRSFGQWVDSFFRNVDYAVPPGGGIIEIVLTGQSSCVDAIAEPTETTTSVQPNRAPVVSLIRASVNLPTTTYTITATDPDNDQLLFVWSGPNCGETKGTTSLSMDWIHDGDRCDHSTDHTDVKITVLVSDGFLEIRCYYQGAGSEGNPTCDAPVSPP